MRRPPRSNRTDTHVPTTTLFRSEDGQAMLDGAQKAFLERADARFKQSEESAGQNLKALLNPVHERLQKYETRWARSRRNGATPLACSDRKSTRLNSSH